MKERRELRALQEQHFRQSFSDMKGQIDEVIEENMDESVQSRTGRGTPQMRSERDNEQHLQNHQ